MAFDLNKNDGSVKDLSTKYGGSAKFDLTKGEAKEVVITDEASNSRNWILGLVGLVLVGAGIWYYTADKEIEKPGSAMVAEVKPPDTTVAIASTVVPVKETANTVEQSVRLNNKTAATFAQGSSSFNKVDHSLIKDIVSYLKEHPGASIHVNGYASSDGTLEINQKVSQARADAFKKYLVSNNIAESNIEAIGKGIESPIASNNTDTGRKKNRRVEIALP